MRTLSTAFLEAINAQETGVVPIILLTIDHDDLDEPILVCNNATSRLSDDPLTYGTVSRGDTYLYIPFEAVLPDETDRAPEAKITIANIGRELVGLIRSVVTPPRIVMEVVLSTDLDTVEMTFAELYVARTLNNAKAVDLELTIDNLGQEPFPAMRFTPSQFPGLFSLV